MECAPLENCPNWFYIFVKAIILGSKSSVILKMDICELCPRLACTTNYNTTPYVTQNLRVEEISVLGCFATGSAAVAARVSF